MSCLLRYPDTGHWLPCLCAAVCSTHDLANEEERLELNCVWRGKQTEAVHTALQRENLAQYCRLLARSCAEASSVAPVREPCHHPLIPSCRVFVKAFGPALSTAALCTGTVVLTVTYRGNCYWHQPLELFSWKTATGGESIRQQDSINEHITGIPLGLDRGHDRRTCSLESRPGLSCPWLVCPQRPPQHSAACEPYSAASNYTDGKTIRTLGIQIPMGLNRGPCLCSVLPARCAFSRQFWRTKNHRCR